MLLYINGFTQIIKCFFFNDMASILIYTLSLHDALPILHRGRGRSVVLPGVPEPDAQCRAGAAAVQSGDPGGARSLQDRKSTRLNSSHTVISYAVFCLKKKSLLFAQFPVNVRLQPVE